MTQTGSMGLISAAASRHPRPYAVMMGIFNGLHKVLGLRVRLPILADASALLHVALSSDLDRRPFSPFAPQQFTVKNNGFTMRLPPQRRPASENTREKCAALQHSSSHINADQYQAPKTAVFSVLIKALAQRKRRSSARPGSAHTA